MGLKREVMVSRRDMVSALSTSGAILEMLWHQKHKAAAKRDVGGIDKGKAKVLVENVVIMR
jgi:hypothetical protein